MAEHDKVRFTYRLTWEKGTGPCGQNCSSSNLYMKGTVPPSLSSMQWKCISGCNPVINLSDINTILTSFSEQSSDWEQGENQFFHINPGTNRYTVRLDGIPWAVPASGPGRLVTTIDLRIRNDSTLPNASPVSAVQPTVGIPFGCPTTITLPVEDPDGDNLQARNAYPDECGGACTSLPKFILKSTLGQLIIDATTKNGYKAEESYRVTLMIEDYPTYTIKIGNDTVTPRHSISKIPLQFTVKVIDNPSSCDNTDMTFAYPTVDDGYRKSYPGFKKSGKFRNGVYVESNLSNSVEFMASLPAGMHVELLKDDLNRNNVSRIYISWIPFGLQSADNIMCVWGKRHNGFDFNSNELYYAGVTCADFPCKNNGTCVDTGKAFICACMSGYTGVDCETEIDECSSNPCKNGGRCVNDINKFSCSCLQNYTGKYCNWDPQQKQKNSEIWPLVVASVCGAAALAGATACCWWCLCGVAANRRKRERVHPKPRSVENNGVAHNNVTSIRKSIDTQTTQGAKRRFSLTPNIEVGSFTSNTYRDAYVIIVYDKIGLKMCGRYCKKQESCVSINYNLETLVCELLKAGGTSMTRAGNFYSSDITSWSTDINPCNPNPCTEESNCMLSVSGGFYCQSLPTPCSSDPCFNSGTCSFSGTAHSCACTHEYYGTQCQSHACSPNPCLNGGICTSTGGLSYSCDCSSGWYGSTCNSNPCSPNPCNNGGICTGTGATSYNCACTSSFTGTTCQKNVAEEEFAFDIGVFQLLLQDECEDFHLKECVSKEKDEVDTKFRPVETNHHQQLTYRVKTSHNQQRPYCGETSHHQKQSYRVQTSNHNYRKLRLGSIYVCRSLISDKKKVELQNLIETHKPDIILGTESHLDNTVASSEVFPEQFQNLYRKDRKLGEGGVFITVDNNYITTEILTGSDCETV
ncbi:JAG2 [Mytilus coruscus]|uniref:JAG2 n=1 Tax=Mytilus coruscus TaxID=42192 RepID=A0A6J8BY47_MYTCO|nr:JAG2 [Mytilus coruscus]